MNKIIVPLFIVLCLFGSGAQAQCSICENVVSIVESWVEANNTIMAIETKLDMLCAVVPMFEGVCEGIIDFDVKSLVGYLERNGDPNTICKRLGVCGGLKAAPLALANKQDNALLKNDQYCYYCEYFFGVLETIIESGAGEEEVATYLSMICTVFPSEAICQFGIYNIAPVMMEYFSVVADPSTVCYDFGVCEYPEDEWQTGYDDTYNAYSTKSDDSTTYSDSSISDNSDSSQDGDEWEDWNKRAVALSDNTKLHAADMCSYCIGIVDWIGYYVRADMSSDQTGYFVDKFLCQISENIQPICETLLNDMEMVFGFFAAQETSQNICFKMSLCDSGSALYDYMRVTALTA